MGSRTTGNHSKPGSGWEPTRFSFYQGAFAGFFSLVTGGLPIYASTLDSVHQSKLVEALHRIVISFVSMIGCLTLLKKGII
jgi:hypothetical protein